MISRRDVVKAAGWTAMAATAGVPRWLRAGTPAWAPYRDAIPIDGAGGVGLIWLEKDDPAVANELTQMRASGMGAVVLTVAPNGRFWLNDVAFEATKATIEKWKMLIARHPDAMLQVDTIADLQRAHRERKIGLIYAFQGSEPLGEDTDRIPMFRQMGVRVIQLTHNRRNLVGDGCMEPGNAGISNFGHEVIARLNAEKIVVDLAHGAQRTIKEGIEACKRPMLISHTGCRALSDLPRNTSDAELRAMADRGGVAGMIFWPYLRTDTQPMAIDVIRHIEHAIRVCGEDHVGIGTDTGVAPIERTPAFEKDNRESIRGMKEDGIFAKDRPDDLYMFIPDLNVANRFEVLGAMLAQRGHSDARIAKILGGNFARVMGEVWG